MEKLLVVSVLAIGIALGLVRLGKAMQHTGSRLRDRGASGRGWAKTLLIIGAMLFGLGWLIETTAPDLVRESIPKPTVRYPAPTVHWPSHNDSP